MTVVANGPKLRVRYGGTEPVNRHCPSVDVLFDSASRITSHKLVRVLLTGMSADGAQRLLHLRLAGALTIAQDQRSCVIYGIPKVAAELGAVNCNARHTKSIPRCSV